KCKNDSVIYIVKATALVRAGRRKGDDGDDDRGKIDVQPSGEYKVGRGCTFKTKNLGFQRNHAKAVEYATRFLDTVHNSYFAQGLTSRAEALVLPDGAWGVVVRGAPFDSNEPERAMIVHVEGLRAIDSPQRHFGLAHAQAARAPQLILA